MNKVFCLGEAMSDTFISLEEAKIVKGREKMICLPYGEKLNVSKMAHKSGGSAFNVSVGLRRLGLDSYLMATVGKDSEGERLKLAMDKEDIDSSFCVESPKFETKAAIILNGEDGDRTIFVYHGKGILQKEMIDWERIEDGSWFYLGPMPDTARELIDYLLEVAVKKNLKLAVNPGSVQVEWSKEDNLKIISKSELYILNKEEARKILGKTKKDKEPLRSFIKAGAKKVIITDGINGSDAFDGSNYYHQDIVKVKTKDMTGAGDAYLAGVVGGLVNGLDLGKAMKWGAINSASVVTKLGAQAELLNLEEIKRKI
ncbi:MAG: putative Ribokinase [Candidatus Berkelbacteria bacterium Licking1014_96]|uniref:Putative Ribokinase n=1 Tax=Candidatus Berkelbacteria bacterium Licking1014_96 TaxID=2017149 RepID=A0A554LH12_9BACT|nr:MAG: putative Ribokinase [Candidatus Berkelbacteria bacterium Licking1014_96]